MEFLIYLLKVSACKAIFYGLYFFAFRKFTFHALNRFYLLCTLCLSFVIPLISFETTKVVKVEPAIIIHSTSIVGAPMYNPAYVPEYNKQAIATIEPVNETPDWRFYTVFGYTFMVTVLLLLFFMKMFKIYQLSTQAVKADNLRIVWRNDDTANASFFNLIFLNTNGLTDNEKAQIIAHECVHIKQLHSIDVLFVELCKIVLWFNPIIYFYKKSLVEVHEFEADLNTIQQFDSKNYAHLLLKLGINHQVDLTNQFSLRPLSTRIQFLFKKRTISTKKVFYFLGLPLFALGIFAFAQRNEKLIYEAKALDKIKSKGTSSSKELKSIDKDSTTEQQEVKPLVSANPIDSVGYKLMVNPFLLGTPEIKLPDYTKNPMRGGNEITITTQSKNTPEYYSFDFFKNGKLITEGVSVDSIKFFQNGKELINGQDFLFVYEKEIITKAIFKQHVRSETLGLIIQIKKITEYKPIKQDGVPLQMRPTPNLNSPWRYKLNIAAQQNFNTDSLRTFMPANFLGKEPLVIINGQEYPSNILHKINPKSFGWSYLANPNELQAIEKYGEKARDGVVEIRTKDDFLFKTEKEHRLALENIQRELDARKIYKNDRIVRVRLLQEDGKEFERIIIKGFFEDKSVSLDVPVNGRIHYEIDGKTVSESDVVNYNGLFQGSGMWHGKTPDRNGYHASISLKTKR